MPGEIISSKLFYLDLLPDRLSRHAFLEQHADSARIAMRSGDLPLHGLVCGGHPADDLADQLGSLVFLGHARHDEHHLIVGLVVPAHPEVLEYAFHTGKDLGGVYKGFEKLFVVTY